MEKFEPFELAQNFYGQVVVGSPGSGKTTYCKAAKYYLEKNGRCVCYVNLDPGNDRIPIDSVEIDLKNLISVKDAMTQQSLGPNGAAVFCLEYLEKNLSWLYQKLKSFPKNTYFLFDFPGQIELYSVHSSVRTILNTVSSWNVSLVAINLIDGCMCLDTSNHISALLVSLTVMLKLELPHINAFTKSDLLPERTLLFNSDFDRKAPDFSSILGDLNKSLFSKKFKDLNNFVCDIMDDFSLLFFESLSVERPETIRNVVLKADKACGYLYANHLEQLNKE